MDNSRELLNLVLDSFSEIKEIVTDTEDIVKCMKESSEPRCTDIVEKSKSLVDKLCEYSDILKRSFYKHYGELKKPLDHINENDHVNCDESVTDTDHDKTLNHCSKESERNTDNVSSDVQNGMQEEIEVPSQENGDNNDSAEQENTNETNSFDQISESVDPDATLLIETVNSKDKCSNPEEKSEHDMNEGEREGNSSETPKSLIRVVDLNKLIDPKPKKSVKFDSSVIILTSSDDESTSPSKKKGNCTTEPHNELRSAMKNSSIKAVGHKNDHVDCSDSTKSTIKKSKRKKDVSSKISNESSRTREFEKRSESEKENSNSDPESNKDIAERNIDNKHKEKCKSDSEDEVNKKSKHKDKRGDSKTRKNSDSENVNSDSDEEKKNSSGEHESELSDSANLSRKSGRLRNINNKLIQKREKLKKIFRRNSDKSFSIAEDFKKTNKDDDLKKESSSKRKSKEILKIAEVLSDTSSFSDNGNNIEEQQKSTSRKSSKKKTRSNSSADKEKEDKFGRKVYVPLPLVQCEKLKEVYLRNKEILEIRSLTRLESLKNKKRSHRRDSKSSSESDKPEIKKSKKKKTVKAKADSSDENKMDSSDEEPLAKKVSIPESITEPIAAIDGDELMADIVLEQSESAHDEAISKDDSDEKDSDTNVAVEKSRKNKDESKKDNEEAKDKNDDSGQITNQDSKNEEKAAEVPVENEDKSENEIEPTTKEKKITDDEEDKNDSDKKTDGENSDSQERKKKKKEGWKKDKLLTEKLDSSESEEEFSKYCKKKDKSKSDIIRKAKKRIVVDSDDSDYDNKKDKKQKESSNESSPDEDEKSSSNNDSEDDKKKEVKKKPSRRRIKRTKDSSSSSDDDKSTRKQIRRVLDRDSLSETTKKAEADEKARKARIAEKQKKYNCYFEEKMDATIEKLVLEYDAETKEEQLAVNKKIAKKLKPHQANGIQFMWDACFETIKRAKNTAGSGCILAHCMGLGKTLQVIALAHTLLKNSEKTKVNKVMVVCPLNTVLNWKNEFKKWVPSNSTVDVHELITSKKNYEKQYVVKEWHEEGGVLIIGYQMFRNLSNPDNKRLSKKMRMVFYEGMVDPGPDLVICDEGHLLKNEKTSLTIAMNRIKTARRVVLTGTPLQNNLKEYWCMVQFIKPNLLGTYKEYLNRFANPIINGQYTDSTQHDILLMRKRSHVLHKLLDGVVQRRDYAVLEPYLPPKFEYVLFVTLTETQVKLYKHYMEKYARQNDGSNRTSFLFTDFQQLQRICTHPRVLKDKSSERKEKDFDDEEESEGSLKDFIDDGDATSEESAKSTSSGSSDNEEGDGERKKKVKAKANQKVRVTRAQAAQRRDNNEESDPEPVVDVKKEWWQDYCDGDELDNINNSGKLFLLFEILRECEEIGDKILVFSQSLYTLNCIEHFLEKIDEATQSGDNDKVGGHKGSWALGLDYFRLDGSSSSENRSIWCDTFNNPENLRSRLFLISTKAGGLGINLVAANRVIIFDVSWNPSHDVQSIYRVYRFGQTKPSYVYRFVTYGTMEMKIYERQVTKQAISKRVIDEQQIDRHYNQHDLQELYKCDLEPTERPIPLVPKDVLLGELLQKHEKRIYKYHLHQSLLENKEAEGLNAEERKAAWDEFENEKVLRKYNYGTNAPNQQGQAMSAQAIAGALTNIVRKDNPNWSEVQIKGIIPALVQQLQVQLQENDTTMYNRVLQEIQLMRMERMREAYYQNQMMRMIQQQQKQNLMAGNMNVNPAQLAQFMAQRTPNIGGPSSSNSRQNEVIELND